MTDSLRLSDLDPEAMTAVLRTRFDAVLGNIAEAAERSARTADEVTLLPVTKTVPSNVLRATFALGFRDFAENRVQELRRKAQELADLGPTWQLIGHLQTNKASQAARLAGVVQSIDSLRIAEALSRAMTAGTAPTVQDTFVTAATQNESNSGLTSASAVTNSAGTTDRVIDVLLEVNTSGEAAKYGLSPIEVPGVLDVVAGLPGLSVRGFMTMAPFTDNQSVIRKTFADLRDLRDRLAPEYEGDGIELSELSMGMSGDYQIAVEEGATIVRVGSALFGQRT